MDIISRTDPIAALATPWGESALAVIRTSGKNSLTILTSVFRPSAPGKDLRRQNGYTICHGILLDGSERIDTVLIAVFTGPRSYTGEDAAEIYCHGGMAIIRRILDLLYRIGFRQAAPGEFTLRAFLNNKMDLTRAEAVNEIVRSRTDRARALALNRLDGKIESKINAVKSSLVAVYAALEAQLDYPEDELEDQKLQPSIIREQILTAECEIERLLATYRTGRIVQEGASIVICGKTNVGKSTLFNLLLKEERAIVSAYHGTTRDYIEAGIAIEGIPIRLYDTAGLRSTKDPLETEGIRRTDRIIRNADLILFIVDATLDLGEDDRNLMAGYRKTISVLPVWNKVDLCSEPPPPGFIPISAETAEGLPDLHREITNRMAGSSNIESAQPVIDSVRQKTLLAKCLATLKSFNHGLLEKTALDALAVDLREAVDCLGEITGEVTSEDVLNEIFSKFCVGK